MNALRITVLTVPDCPNAPLALDRITAALDGREAEVELVELRDEAEAARWGMTGSPTVLVDGVDPFAVPGAPDSVSCRLYRDEEGRGRRCAQCRDIAEGARRRDGVLRRRSP